MTNPESRAPNPEPRAPLPYWRLSGFYLFYFGVVGLYMPYWPLYLDSLGLTAGGIGLYFGVTSAMRILAPNLWGWLADRSNRRMPFIRLALVMAALMFFLLGQVSSLTALLILGMLMGFFWTGALPQFEAVTLGHLGNNTDAYPRVRIWGSIGFILTVTGIGYYFEWFPIDHLPLFITAVMLICLLNTALLPEAAVSQSKRTHESLSSVLKKPSVIVLLLAAFFMQFSHAPYYTFYSLYLSEHGYAKTIISAMWSLGVLAEVVAFLLMRRFIRLWGLRYLMIGSLLLAALRWWMIATFVDNMALMLLAQLLHGATFGVFHAVVILLIHKYFPGRLQGRGQALYSSLSFGMGVALGSLIAGAMWEPLGATPTYLMAAVVTAVAALLCWKWLEEEPSRQQ